MYLKIYLEFILKRLTSNGENTSQYYILMIRIDENYNHFDRNSEKKFELNFKNSFETKN